MMGAARILITAVVTADFLITAGAEGFFTFTGQNNDANIVIIAGISQRLNHLFNC
ncbi:Uncharacterised protein [Yersinia enterocolitica]|nr:Uncharacterised protein [Yersinia enterocolitica]